MRYVDCPAALDRANNACRAFLILSNFIYCAETNNAENNTRAVATNKNNLFLWFFIANHFRSIV